VPPGMIGGSPQVEAAWQRAVAGALDAYREILAELVPLQSQAESEIGAREALRAVRSVARSVLPNATETKILVTANARALRHFLGVRGAIPGDEEMRRVAALLLAHLKQEAPALFFDFVEDSLPDGSPMVCRRPASSAESAAVTEAP
jgi:thymidylate synthase (FAD)